mmetsp:Transcript_22461/g.49766  ORF Transcript_22461/g.49766 Transcript_22461/m.49766 type:complete len:282 (-) Transcript_22461:185-1030(-)
MADADLQPARTELTHPCSRTKSRAVRQALGRVLWTPKVLKQVAKNNKTTPSDCPLDFRKDLYDVQEAQKHKLSTRGVVKLPEFTCGFCGRAFKSEHYLDLHMERRHMDKVPEDAFCLADYCEVFEVCNQQPLELGAPPGRKRAAAKRQAALKSEACNDTLMADAKEQCHILVHKCLPLSEGYGSMHVDASRNVCQMLDCHMRSNHALFHHDGTVPVMILFIGLFLAAGCCFAVMLVSVEHGDWLLEAISSSGLASVASVRRLLRSRRVVRKRIGLEETSMA